MENCYFWLDEKNNKQLTIICEKCHEKKPVGWYWEGSRLGYGPFNFVCDICEHIIYKPEPKQKD
jgi:hypothetical protein